VSVEERGDGIERDGIIFCYVFGAAAGGVSLARLVLCEGVLIS
jgi:hypothetical protein